MRAGGRLLGLGPDLPASWDDAIAVTAEQWVSASKEVVRVILEAGANVEVHNEICHTPLWRRPPRDTGVPKILLEFGEGINNHQNEFKVRLINTDFNEFNPLTARYHTLRQSRKYF